MRLLISVLLGAALVAASEQRWASPWPEIFSSVNLDPANLKIVVGEGAGFTATPDKITVRRIVDVHRPQLEIYWDQPATIPRYQPPPGATVFAHERWSGAPVLAGLRDASGVTLWLAIGPGRAGYERFPYLPQALHDLGLQPQARSRDLWAFFDSSYRLRADPDVLARRWREAGIAALHIAAWHYWEQDPQRDAWLSRLIEICHNHAIQVYAWVEFPHISEQFWREHPEWREKTASLGDAHLDWRKLMNLQNAACAREVERGVRALARRFDWDGINLGELYFESLEGYGNPSRFTPMNDDVRSEFRREAGFDPAELFAERSNDTPGIRRFLEYRARLALRMQEQWLGVLSSIREQSPHLDLVLTHIDDRFDTQIRDLLGADASQVLPLLKKHDFTFLVEDPATIWHLGPQRYTEIGKRYRSLTDRRERLAIDINVVERYQDVYPTKQQTGVELFQLINGAARAFERVALYFENSILPPDVKLLSASAAAPRRIERSVGRLTIESERDVWVAWEGAAKVNGSDWPIHDGEHIRLPAGRSVVEPAAEMQKIRILDLNARLIRASASPEGVEIEYESRARAMVRLNARPSHVVVDGQPMDLLTKQCGEVFAMMLPAGRHRVYFAATS